MSTLMTPMAKHLRRLAHLAAPLLEVPSRLGSPARALADSPLLTGMGATRPGLETVTLPPLLLGHTFDHMRGLAATLEAEYVIYSCMSLVRPALESAGSAFYLLDPDVDDRERIRRWANLHMSSIVERLRMLPPEERGGETGLRFGNQLYWLTLNAGKEGFEVTKGPQRQPGLQPDRYLEPRPPSDQRRITELLDDLGENSGAGPLIHRMTSAVAHGQVHGITLFVIADESVDNGDGTAKTRMGMTFGDWAKWTAPLLWGVRRVMHRSAPFYDWDLTTWDKAMTAALADWRQWIR